MGVRRIVAGHDKTGNATIQFDSEASNVHKPTGNIETTLLWVTDKTPANNEGSADTADQDIGIPPPPNGSIFRVVEFGPESSQGGSDEREYLSSVGATQHESARHPGMHKTHSIDYAIIMSGEIDMLVDDDEVHVKAGDVVVQRGNNHAWVNRSTKPCKIAFVLIDSDPIT
jgi:mannose-6-phosphate isomerase-like protein (cupin superfamily)